MPFDVVLLHPVVLEARVCVIKPWHGDLGCFWDVKGAVLGGWCGSPDRYSWFVGTVHMWLSR